MDELPDPTDEGIVQFLVVSGEIPKGNLLSLEHSNGPTAGLTVEVAGEQNLHRSGSQLFQYLGDVAGAEQRLQNLDFLVGWVKVQMGVGAEEVSALLCTQIQQLIRKMI